MATKVGSSSKSVVYWRFSTCSEEVGGLVRPIWTVCLDEILRCVGKAAIGEETKK